MNKQRREELYTLMSKLGKIKGVTDLSKYIETLETIKAAEEDYCWSVPGNLRFSARYEEAEEAVDCLEDAIDFLHEAYDYKEREDFFLECITDAIDNIAAAL